MRNATIRNIDWVLLATVLLLMGMGLLSLYAYKPPVNLTTEPLKSTFFRQLIFAVAALGLMILGLVPNYLALRRVSFLLYLGCIGALVAVLKFGPVTRGARGWFPVGPFMLQPAEFMKIALVLMIARHLMHAKQMQRASSLAVPLALAALPTALVLLQPDLGTALLFFPAALAMLFAAGARVKHIVLVIAIGLAAMPPAYFFGLKQYQRNRLISFAFPDSVPRALTYQQSQSVRAVASGEVSGRGIGESAASFPFYIPDRHTDFVFSITAQDLGFVGASFLLLLYALFFLQSLRIAWTSREPYGRLVATGITTIIAMQVFINVGMTIGVAPITGLTLPFVSYGGSSLLSCTLMAALLLNIGSRWVPTFATAEAGGGRAHIRELDPGKPFEKKAWF